MATMDQTINPILDSSIELFQVYHSKRNMKILTNASTTRNGVRHLTNLKTMS